MSGWTAFWLLCAVFVVCDLVIALHGIDSVFWQFKTEPELSIQKKLSGAGVRSPEYAE